jgi:tripartite-type tricarboxylate transporter receptor subunit TctC
MGKLLLSAMLALATAAAAQGYPTKTVRLVVADAAGGAPDQLGRIVAQKLSETLGQSMIVDNRPGAAGVLGADLVSKAPADGYTLLLTTTSIYALIPSMKKNLPYDAVKDFVAISRIATASNVLVVTASLPANSVAELIAIAQGKPGVYNYASAGIGSPAHLAGEMLNLLAGIKITHVPYKGAAPGLLDVIAGNPHLIITSPISAAGHMNAGRVRALATTGAQRNPRLPDLPTIADTVPGYEISQTWGLAAPTGTPSAFITRLSDETGKAMRLADVKERVLGMGAVPAGDTPAQFQAYIDGERRRLGDVIARTGIVLSD